MVQQKKIILLHPTGNMNTRAALRGFFDAGILGRFDTCIACFRNTFPYLLSGLPFLKELRRREYPEYLKHLVRTRLGREAGRQIASKMKISPLLKHETGFFCIDNVYRDLDKHVSGEIRRNHERFAAVYAYEDCAFNTFTEAKSHKMKCMLDLPTGYWRAMRKLLSEEKMSNPEWAMTLRGFNDSEEKLGKKDMELAMADRIYVASSFTKKTLELYPGKLGEIEIIPYGFPPVRRSRVYQPFGTRKIKALFVGGLSQQKGLSYLFEAVNGLENHIELTIVGRGDLGGCPALESALKKVNHIPSLSHDRILDLMSEHDLFIFPSLFEGFGLVITEAMSQGTPVITTERTCGPDIITHGKDGWIVKAGSAKPIRELLMDFIRHPEMIQEVGRNAMMTAASRPWRCYEQELAVSVKLFLNGNC